MPTSETSKLDLPASPKATSNDQAQVQAQHPPPPVPSAAALPFNPSSSSSSSNPIWPDSFLLFLDPLSVSVIPKIVQILSKFTYNNPPRQTALLAEATHIVIDPTSPFGDAVLQHQARQQPSRPPQLLVTAEWLKECIFWEEWLDEGKFMFVRPEGKKKKVVVGKEREAKGGGQGKGREVEVEMDKPEGDEESDEDESDSPPDLPSSGRWLRSEDDALARLLLPIEGDYSALDKNGRNAFDRFAMTELTRRTGSALRERFRVNETEFKARIEVLRSGDAPGRARRVSMAGKGKGKEKEKERAKEESSSSEDDDDVPERTIEGVGRGSGIRDPYTDQEELDLRKCLQSTSYPVAAFRNFSALHSRRTYHGVRKHYYKHRDRYEGLLLPVDEKDEAETSPLIHWTVSEEEDLIQRLLKPYKSMQQVFRDFHAEHPIRTVDSVKNRYYDNRARIDQAVLDFENRSSLKSKLKSRQSGPKPGPTRSSRLTRNPPTPVSSSSKRSLDKVDGPSSSSSSSSKYPRREVSPLGLSSPIASGSNSKHQPLHPRRRSPSPLSDINSSSDSDSEFEPPSFLQLGVPPSALSPTSPSCYWCGTGEDESSYFKMLELAEEDPEKITRVEGRLACSFCVERTEKWVAREEREMGKLERLAWLGRKLEATGRKERATLVRVEEGGTGTARGE